MNTVNMRFISAQDLTKTIILSIYFFLFHTLSSHTDVKTENFYNMKRSIEQLGL